MSSSTVKQIIRAGVGLLYAVAHGLWTMLATGGGHGNFIWFMLFLYVDFFGGYFPVMGALSADLRSRATRIVFGSLILFNLVASAVLILAWVTGATGKSLDAFDKTLQMVGPLTLLFCGFLHFLPTAVFGFMLANAIAWGTPTEDEETTTLNLS